MVQDYKIAGLTQQQMYAQGELFKQAFNEVVNRVGVKNSIGDLTGLVEILFVDDLGKLIFFPTCFQYSLWSKGLTHWTDKNWF